MPHLNRLGMNLSRPLSNIRDTTWISAGGLHVVRFSGFAYPHRLSVRAGLGRRLGA